MIVLRDLRDVPYLRPCAPTVDMSVMRGLRAAALAESRRLRTSIRCSIPARKPRVRSGPVPSKRFPYEPLAAVCERLWRPLDAVCMEHIGTTGKVAQVLNVNTGTVARWRKLGLTLDTADKYATELGYHPGEIWSEWWEVAC